MNIDLTRGEKVGVLGALLTLIGSIMPWASVGAFSASGVQGDGVFTLIIAIIVGVLILSRSWDYKNSLGLIASGAAVFLIAMLTFSNIAAAGSGPFGLTAEAGIGLFLSSRNIYDVSQSIPLLQAL